MPQLLALAAAIGWASGVRLYLVVLLTGLAGYLGWMPLPGGLQLLAHPVVIAASGFMVFVEFFADKIPGLDSLWDMVHTAIRIPAGAALAAGVFGADHAAMAIVAALLGGGLAATAHAAKATTRAAINTSPEPFSNVGASLVEDAVVPAGLWLAIAHPLRVRRAVRRRAGAQRVADPQELALPHGARSAAWRASSAAGPILAWRRPFAWAGARTGSFDFFVTARAARSRTVARR